MKTGDHIIGTYLNQIVIGTITSRYANSILYTGFRISQNGAMFCHPVDWNIIKIDQVISLYNLVKLAQKYDINQTKFKEGDIVIFKRFRKIYVGRIESIFIGLYTVITAKKTWYMINWKRKYVNSYLRRAIKLKDLLNAFPDNEC